jgi:hypothetical protein
MSWQLVSDRDMYSASVKESATVFCVPPLALGSSWTDWSHMWGREAYLKRVLEKLNLGYPRDSDD